MTDPKQALLNSTLSGLIDKFYKSRSKRLHYLNKVSCQIWKEKKRKEGIAEETSSTEEFLEKDDREEIQLVIDKIRKEHGKGACVPLTYLKKNMNSIVMVVRKEDLEESKSKAESEDEKRYELKSTKLKDRTFFINNKDHVICPKSKYAEQRSAFCLGTGFFIQPNVIVTAAHVIYPSVFDRIKDSDESMYDLTQHLNTLRFVTNVKVTTQESRRDKISIPKKDVYKPVAEGALLAGGWASLGEDWAVIRVEKVHKETIPPGEEERTVKGYQTEVKEGDDVYCLGHGFGLPLKISMMGKVKEVSKCKEYFDCDLDVFSGNSGSPVFNLENHKVVGILIRGERNFVHGQHEDHEGKHCLVPSTASSAGDLEECQYMNPVIAALENLPSLSREKAAPMAPPQDNGQQPEALKKFPYTYLRKGREKGQVELFICVPAVKNKKLKFPNVPKEAPRGKNLNFKKMIRFIDCKYGDADPNDGSAFEFARYVLSRSFCNKDETIEVRLPVLDKEDKIVPNRFHRTMLFFDDAKERDDESKDKQKIAVEKAYTFIEIKHPEPVQGDGKEPESEFFVHVLMPFSEKLIHLQTIRATKGTNSWSIAPVPRIFNGNGPAPGGLEPGNPLQSLREIQIDIHERLARIDKPETPPLGSTGGP